MPQISDKDSETSGDQGRYEGKVPEIVKLEVLYSIGVATSK